MNNSSASVTFIELFTSPEALIQLLQVQLYFMVHPSRSLSVTGITVLRDISLADLS